MLDRAAARELLNQHVQSPSLRTHCQTVATAVEAYAQVQGADRDLWYIAALLHDFDYEEHPNLEEHPFAGVRLLKELGYPETVTTAILSHADYSGTPRTEPLHHALFACDELCGFIVAVSRVRPSKSVHEVTVANVRKKMKEKSFAAAVNRDDIVAGAAELGVELDNHIAFVIKALQAQANTLGLAGTV
ncbi:MAG: HDIG domain-containing protein [Herpetosiphonaceae bacterium]|nr:HDIG domain-containing protein [Herpetosiphonaceae bacterium]